MVIQELYNLDKFGIQRAKINSNFTELKDALDSFTDSETVSKTFYIKATGSDITGDGSIGNPYKTITKVKSVLKKNIRTDITIVYQGTNVVEVNWLDFSDFTVYTDNYDNFIQITGELEKVEDVTLTKDGDWKYSDSSKNWIPNEHKGRFLSDSIDWIDFPTLVPIRNNTDKIITAESYSYIMNNVNMIVESSTFITIENGDELLITPNCDIILNEGLYLLFMNIDSGEKTIKVGDTKGGTWCMGCSIINYNSSQSMIFNYKNLFLDNIFYFKKRVLNGSSADDTCFRNSMFHKAMPRNLSENTDEWFLGHHFLDIGGGFTVSKYTSFQYFFSCISAGYCNEHELKLTDGSCFYLENCSSLFESRGSFATFCDNRFSIIAENTTHVFWGKYATQAIRINFKEATITGIDKSEYISHGGTSVSFDYDAGDGNVTHNLSVTTDEFNSETKYIDVAKDYLMLFPGIYPEFSSPEKVNILNNTNTDLIIGNELNRKLVFKTIVDGVTEFAEIKLSSINSDDTSSSLQSNALLESNETGSNIKANIGGTTGLIFTYSKVSDEFIINIDNKTGLDLDLTWEMERSRK